MVHDIMFNFSVSRSNMQFVTTRYRKRSVFVGHVAQHLHEERCMPEVSQFYVDHREYREEIIKEKVIVKAV